MLLELTEAKWELRRLAIVIESELNDDHLSVHMDKTDEVASLDDQGMWTLMNK